MVTRVNTPTLSVVVPATDRPSTLGRARAAIDAAHEPPDQVIVVDGPGDLSASEARNVGAERATGDVVVFVDADVEVHPDVFSRIRAVFTAQPQLDAVFGSYDDTPGSRRWVSAFRNLLHHHVHRAAAGPATTFWTGLGAVRRTTFLAVGGFDGVRYPHPSIEDIDLGHRLVTRGGQVVLDPTIQGTHLKVWTLRSMLWTDFARRGIPWVALQVRERKLSNALNCGWRHRASAAVCALAAVGPVLGYLAAVPVAAALLVALNHRFYRLLARRLGWPAAVAGIVLHGLHHLVSVAAVGAGLVAILVSWARSGRTASPSEVADQATASTSAPCAGAAARQGGDDLAVPATSAAREPVGASAGLRVLVR